MPYIHCESCGSGCYTNVLSCPVCGAPVRADRQHGLVPRRRRRSMPPIDDPEDEVRVALYGERSGCVELRGAGGVQQSRAA